MSGNVRELHEKFPKLFMDKDGKYHPAFYGISCQNGWNTILTIAFDAIQYYLNINNSQYEFQISCVKEKFGGLRIYCTGTDDYIQGIIRMTENLADCTCEYCGSTREVGRTSRWIRTICKSCMEKRPDITDKWDLIEALPKPVTLQ